MDDMLTKNTIYTTKSGDVAIEKVIISCPKCRQKTRVPLFKIKILSVACPKCQNVFRFNCRIYRLTKRFLQISLVIIAIIITFACVALPFLLLQNYNQALAQIQQSYATKILNIQDSYNRELIVLKEEHNEKLTNVDSGYLKQQAHDYYGSIWKERLSYNSRYAITPREQAQLEMLSLSREKNKSIEEIVESIASESAPKNSEIRAYTTPTGVSLDVNFDMSEVTTGEKDTKTKHRTIESLKKETIRLISRVTTDLYEFCKGLDLESLAIGCKHFVGNQDGLSYKENIVIYKIRLNREDIKNLDHNPFLDIYAITKYFIIEQDSFPNLYLEDSL